MIELSVPGINNHNSRNQQQNRYSDSLQSVVGYSTNYPQQQGKPGADSDTNGSSAKTMVAANSTHDPLTPPTGRGEHANNDNNNNWAVQEGLRRVRADQVAQKMRLLTFLSALGGFLFGYDTGVVSGAMLQIRTHFHLSNWEQEVVVSITVLGALITSSAGIGGRCLQQYGRKPTLQVASVIFVLGSIWLALSQSYQALVWGRLILGIAIGLASLATPLYIAEMATGKTRGRLVTCNALLVVLGQVVANVVDALFYSNAVNGWRYMLGLAALPALVMGVGLLQMPESPRWLGLVGRVDEAERVLQIYRESNAEAQAELQDILGSIQTATQTTNSNNNGNSTDQAQDGLDGGSTLPARTEYHDDENGNGDDSLPPDSGQSSSSPEHYGTTDAALASAGASSTRNNINAHNDVTFATTVRSFFEMLQDTPTRRALTLGCGLMLIQQCSGINTIMYYAASIYTTLEFSEITSIWLSGLTALAQLVGILLSLRLVDSTGRRTLVLTSLGLVVLALMGLGGCFYLARVASPAVKAFGSCASAAVNANNSKHHWFRGDGATRYCYDCVALSGCGVCGGHCVPGTVDGPDDVDMCMMTSTTNPFTNNDDDAAIDWTTTHCDNPYGWLSVIFMFLYLLAFGVGMGGLPWTIHSEIYPLRYRSLAMSCSTATNWTGNLIIASSFLSLASAVTTYGAFWLYALVAVVGWLWLYCHLPETKGLSLEEIETLFQDGADGGGYDQIDMDDDDDDSDYSGGSGVGCSQDSNRGDGDGEAFEEDESQENGERNHVIS